MRAVDSWAIEECGIASLDLMEVAGRAVADAVAELAPQGPIRILCGKGNNGGDGFVAARHLSDAGFDVQALLLGARDELSDDAAANAERLGGLDEIGPEEVAGRLAGSGVVVDAMFGTGFEGEPRDPIAAAIAAINDCDAPVVACDIASGVDASSGEVAGKAVVADVTVTFHAGKTGHFIRPGKEHAGEVRVVEIGIPDGAPVGPAAGVIEACVLADAPVRGPASTKFSSGNLVVIGGARGMTGAVCMAALAGGRAGAGYVTAVVPASLEAIFEVKLTEAMTVGCPDQDGALCAEAADAALKACERADAVVLGSGLGKAEGSMELARDLAKRVEVPLVIDADGLNAHADRAADLSSRGAATVLTPHDGELGRLLGRESDEIRNHRLACATEAARLSGAIVVLKGDDTIVTDGERVAINALAAPALATAGTGDVMAGVIGALLARGMEPFSAACAGALAGARAGRNAADRIGLAESVVATDVIASVPAGLRPE